jgi:hypothetical protein
MFMLLLLLLGCREPRFPHADIWVAGNQSNNCARMWFNDTDGKVLTEIESFANGIFVTENRDVYIAGREGDDNFQTAVYWLNGKINYLSHEESNANDIFVYAESVFVVGQYTHSRNTKKATIWKNGIRSDLSDENSDALSMYVTGDYKNPDIYVAGITGEFVDPTNRFATVWKNGHPQRMSEISSIAHGVFVYKGDVYVVGVLTVEQDNRATIWKNGEPQLLANTNSWAQCVYVYSGDVYVVGSINRRATIWKNGKATTLSESELSFANSVFVMGKNVFVTGSIAEGGSSKAYVWGNGIPMKLSDRFSGGRAVHAMKRPKMLKIER